MAIEAAIKKAGFKKDEVMVTGDIGCTILGMNPPFDLLWNEVSMGSSVSLAQGYVHAGIKTPVIATIGDSTFFHGGIPGVLNAVQHRTPLVVVVMDNGWTAMTGMQVNPGTARVRAEGRATDRPRDAHPGARRRSVRRLRPVRPGGDDGDPDGVPERDGGRARAPRAPGVRDPGAAAGQSASRRSSSIRRSASSASAASRSRAVRHWLCRGRMRQS